MAERSKAAVSKTVNGFFPFGGSNPPLSAIFMLGFRVSFSILPHFLPAVSLRTEQSFFVLFSRFSLLFSKPGCILNLMQEIAGA